MESFLSFQAMFPPINILTISPPDYYRWMLYYTDIITDFNIDVNIDVNIDINIGFKIDI